MTKDSTPLQQSALDAHLPALIRAANDLNARLSRPFLRVIGTQLVKGIAFGLGSVLGASLFVSILIYSLSSIDFLPIIGGWASQIVEQIQNR